MTTNQHLSQQIETPRSHTRRKFLTKASYAAPALLSLPAMPAFAQTGSPGGGGNDGGGPVDCLSLYDEFLAANGYPSLAELQAAFASQDELTPEQQAAFDALLAAFPDGTICGMS